MPAGRKGILGACSPLNSSTPSLCASIRLFDVCLRPP
jgi:hypothetical protein